MPKWIVNKKTNQVFEIADFVPVPEGFELLNKKKEVEGETPSIDEVITNIVGDSGEASTNKSKPRKKTK